MRNDFECILLVIMLKRKPRDRSNISSRPVNKAMADKVRHEVAVKNGDAVDIDSDDDAEGDDGPSFMRTQLLDLCQQLEIGCMQHGDPQSTLHLSSELRIFHAKLRREELLNAKQTSIDSYFKV